MDTTNTELIEENEPLDETQALEPAARPQKLRNAESDVPSLRNLEVPGRRLRIARLLLPVERRHAFVLQEQDSAGRWKMITFKVGWGKKREPNIENIELAADIVEFLESERIENISYTDLNAWSVFLEIFPPLGRENRYEVLH